MMLLQQLAHLEADNLDLRLKLQVGTESTSKEDKSVSITSKLESMIQEGSSEQEIRKAIQELQERFSDYGRDRRSAIQFHISQLRRCLLPTQTTRAILFLMSCAPMFNERDGSLKDVAKSDLSELWMSLLDELKPTPEQRAKMMSFTLPKNPKNDPFVGIKAVTDNCNSMVDRLEEMISDKNESLDNEMTQIQTILSGRQIAKYILWIDQNPATMQMLEALWPHLTYSKKRKASSLGDESDDESLSSGD